MGDEPSGAAGISGRGQLLVPAALLLLIGVATAMLVHGRRSERAQQDIVRKAMHDYSAVVAWQFARRAADAVHANVMESMRPVSALTDAHGAPGADMKWPSPAILLQPDSLRLPCSLIARAQYAFRIDLPEGRIVTTDSTLDPAMLAILAKRVSAIAEHNAEPHRLVFDTIAGRRRVLALDIVRGSGAKAPPRVIYGVETVASALDSIFRTLVERPGLLPDALIKGSLDSAHIRVRLRSPDGVALFEYGRPLTPAGLATDTVVTGAQPPVLADVELSPSLASALLIGGLPESGLPMSSALLSLFALGVVVSVAAVYQLNRGRELGRLRARFIANVSHELRTPLAQISMFAETLMLSRERSVSERLQFASIIHREARRLSHLVETVLRFSAADARQPRLQLERVDLGEFVDSVVQTFEPMALAADTRLVVEPADRVYASIDCAAMQQVVVNLLDNALKHGGPGKRVWISLGVGQSEIMLHIEDEGPGVPASDRARIFEPFVRVEPPGARRVPGAGIGLAVVQAIVAAHGGRVVVDQGGHGARFTVFLPLTAAVAGTAVRAVTTSAEAVATP